MATLGFGDVTPADPILRLLAPFEALLGFVLLTAAIAWILQVYPALGRRRSVAKRLSILRSACTPSTPSRRRPLRRQPDARDAVTDGMIQAETDLMQYAESYYFLEEEPELSLAATLPSRADAGGGRRTSSSREVHLAADMLTSAVESIARCWTVPT